MYEDDEEGGAEESDEDAGDNAKCVWLTFAVTSN